MDAFRVRNFHSGHAQVEPGVDALSLLLRQGHHRSVQQLPLLLFLQQFLRGGDSLMRRFFDTIAVVQGVMGLVPELPALVGSFRPLAGADRCPYFVGHFYKGIGIICIGIQFPQIDFFHWCLHFDSQVDG